MRKITAAVAAAVLLLAADSSAQVAQQLDEEMQKLFPLEVSVGSTRLQCERELDAAMAGTTDAQAEALFLSAVLPVRLQQPVQLSIRLASGQEVPLDVTNDPRTKYVTNACLITTNFGLVTVTQTGPQCVVGKTTDLMVLMEDAYQTKAWNRCFFKITQ